jgi:hypothetical protein
MAILLREPTEKKRESVMRKVHFRFALIVVSFWMILGTALAFAAADAGGPQVSPTEALARLIAGNERFQNDKTGHPLLHSERREELVGGQSPFAVILSCSDSRVPPAAFPTRARCCNQPALSSLPRLEFPDEVESYKVEIVR